jgi:hypothetical protein
MTSDSRSAQSKAAGSPKPSRGRGFGKPKDSGADSSSEEKEVIPRTPNQFYKALLGDSPPLTSGQMEVLRQQEISETVPGTILVDFEQLLEFVGEGSLPVGPKNHLISVGKDLAALNQILTEPMQIALQRPQQKSYSSIHGLYLLLRCTGLGKIIFKGKKPLLIIDPTMRSHWVQLNPTEKYFMLLEAWMIRGHYEILGEPGGRSNCISYVTQSWPTLATQGKKLAKYADQEMLQYSPGSMNLALMQLFGFVQIVSVQPEAGKGWRFKSVKPLPWGDAVVQLVAKADWDNHTGWDSERDITLAFGELQSYFKPYFPGWKRNLPGLTMESKSGVFTFKVSLGEIWRRIAIGSDMQLSDLADLILDSVDFDRDHLDMFTYKDPLGRKQNVMHPSADGAITTTEVNVGALPIEPGGTLEYVFDFGDWWKFGLQLESVVPGRGEYQGEILEVYGDAPVQYSYSTWS